MSSVHIENLDIVLGRDGDLEPCVDSVVGPVEYRLVGPEEVHVREDEATYGSAPLNTQPSTLN